MQICIYECAFWKESKRVLSYADIHLLSVMNGLSAWLEEHQK